MTIAFIVNQRISKNSKELERSSKNPKNSKEFEINLPIFESFGETLSLKV